MGMILVIGGYGHVGRVIATELARHAPGQVIAAGRNAAKAEQLAWETDGAVVPLALDLARFHEHIRVLDNVSLVAMCLDQPDTRFLEACLARDIDYVDVTAEYDFLAAAEQLDGRAQTSGSTAILSVGLAPGLTNLLARHARSVLTAVARVDIFVLLGLGEVHGEAAIRWMLRHINAEFSVAENGQAILARSFEGSKQTVFPAGLGKRRAYRFSLPDQFVLPRTLTRTGSLEGARPSLMAPSPTTNHSQTRPAAVL